jgi:hypothetical protein
VIDAPEISYDGGYIKDYGCGAVMVAKKVKILGYIGASVASMSGFRDWLHRSSFARSEKSAYWDRRKKKS